MAWTNTLRHGVQGRNRTIEINMTSDSATQEFYTGLQRITSMTKENVSANTAGTTFTPNKLSAGTASNGYLSVTGSTSGDNFLVKVEGY